MIIIRYRTRQSFISGNSIFTIGRINTFAVHFQILNWNWINIIFFHNDGFTIFDDILFLLHVLANIHFFSKDQ